MNLIKDDSFVGRNSFLLITAAWLLTFAFIINNYWSGSSTSFAAQKAIEKNISRNLEKIEKFSSDTSLLNTFTSGKYDEAQLQQQVDKSYFIFFYKIISSSKLVPVFWNTQVIEPDYQVLNSGNGTSFRKLLNGWYVVKNKTYEGPSGNKYKLVFLVPVKWNYYIENRYLHNSFVAENNIAKTYDISLSPTKYSIKDPAGNVLFYLQQLSNPQPHDNAISILLRILASILLLFFLHKLANFYVRKKGFWFGLLVLVVPLFFFKAH